MNRFTIDENDQFEIPYAFQAGLYSRDWTQTSLWHIYQILSEEAKANSSKFRNHLHFIVTKRNVMFDYSFFIHSFKTFAETCRIEKATFTFVASKKQRCITKEDFEVFYKVDEDVDRRDDVSIGEDLESLLERIKSGKICNGLVPVNDEMKESFNIQLLTPEEMVKLQQKDETFLKTFASNDPDVPKKKMDESDSKKKFSYSSCWRKTCFMRLKYPQYIDYSL